jgi:hypothetical protein
MLKQHFFNRSKRFQQITATLVVLTVAVVGTLLLLGGHAASPYASISADKGSLTGAATIQTASSASDGKYVQFGSAGSGGGGTGVGGGGNNMIVGLNGGGWGPGTPGAKDLSNVVKYVRYDAGGLSEPISDFSSNGVKIEVLFSGDTNGNYNTGGVSAINASNWANYALSWYKANCTTTECPMIEVLNEPGGDWFWGSNASSTTNAAAYAHLLQTVYNTFNATYGTSRPLILASFDGGGSGNSWGQSVWNTGTNGGINVSNYVDGVTVHPYGGTGNSTQSAQGDRTTITDSHTQSGKPVYITEVGWPTAVGQPSTGDSLQWSETAQCNNIYNFMSWSRSTGYVNAVVYFNYVDYGSNDFYGIVRWGNPAGADGSDKPSYNGLKAAAQNLPNPC